MTHQLQFDHETDTDAVFTCALCGKSVGFNKDGIGEPHAALVNGAWVPPQNADEYFGECQ